MIDCPAGTTEPHAVLLMANQLPSYIQRWGDDAVKAFGATLPRVAPNALAADVPDVETAGMPERTTPPA